MPQRPHGEAFGMFDCERRIMEMSDSGCGAREIAAELDVEPRYVSAVIGRYNFASLGSQMSAAEAATRHADRLFQRALAASGGRFA